MRAYLTRIHKSYILCLINVAQVTYSEDTGIKGPAVLGEV